MNQPKTPRRTWRRRYHEYLTVGQIGELCCVDRKTVRRWIDSGLLEGMRVPEEINKQAERRVHYEVLRDFLIRIGYFHSVEHLDAHFPPEAPTDNLPRVVERQP